MNSAVGGFVYFAGQRFRGGVRQEMIRRAEAILNGPPSIVRGHVEDRLAEQFTNRIGTLQGLEREPLSDRVEMTARMRDPSALDPAIKVEHRRTSGSTASPYRFVKDMEMIRWMDAAMWACYDWHGIRPGDRQARFWGVPRGTGPRLKRRAFDLLLNRRRLDAFRLRPDRLTAFFHAMRHFRPTHAYGYPNLLHHFTEHCVREGLGGQDLGIRVVVTTGEMLTPGVRSALADFFGARVVDEYGCSESGIIAFECERNAFHTVPLAVYPEVVDDSGTRVAVGEAGEVVITDLFGRVLPLRRYRLHDVVTWSGVTTCDCGRSLARIRLDQGRRYTLIRRPGSDPVYANILGYTVPDGVLRFRVQQVALDRLDALVVLNAEADSRKVLEECRKRWSAALDDLVDVQIRAVPDEEIPFPASGKLQYFVPMEPLRPTHEAGPADS